MGEAPEELPLLTLALDMRVNPAEIAAEWDEYWVNRLLMLMEARNVARSMR